MAMDIYFLRHGETQWNHEKRLQGSTPYTDLTDFGVRLAEWTRDGFKARGVSFDRAYTSPLLRARHTAEIVARGLGLEPVDDARLREMDFGAYEGSLIRDGEFADDNIRNCFRDPPRYVPPPGAESFEEVEARLAAFLADEMRPLEGKCAKVLAVSHGYFMRMLVRHMMRAPLASIRGGRQPNCCVHIVRLEGGVFHLVEQGVVFYDQALAATVPSV